MERTEMDYIERTSSIENEPRTLNLDQIQFAREAALFVVNTRGVEEAMRIFTQGLEAVESCVRDEKEGIIIGDTKLSSSIIKGDHDLEGGGGVRDIASAPF